MSAELSKVETPVMLLPPTDEAERLNALIRYQIHTLEADGFLNDFTQLAADLLGRHR